MTNHVCVCVCVCVGGPQRFVLTSPGGSARQWFPWRTRASFEANEADWLSPSEGSGSQTAPGGWTPDNPVSQEEDKREDEEEELEWAERRRERMTERGEQGQVEPAS